MYAVIRKYELDQRHSEETDRKVREGFVPLLKEIPGFVAYYWLDTGEGLGASSSVFQDKAAVEESVGIAADFVREQLAGVAISSPEITEGEVQAHG